MNDVINALIGKYGYVSYLEIGVGQGNTFNRIRCSTKYAVDPKPVPVLEKAKGETISACWLPSDDFFATLAPETLFDIVFVDGAHLCEQVTRDIRNSLKHLLPGGSIVVHDVNPSREAHATRAPSPGCAAWNGDVWRAWIPVVGMNINATTIMTGHGLGVWEDIDIVDAYVPEPALTVPWDYFDAHRNLLLRARS